MAPRDKLRRLEKAIRGRPSSFELVGGRRYYFDPEAAFKVMFGFFTASMLADFGREARPEVPGLLKAVADAKDRGEALARVVDGRSRLPLDREALLECGEFVPRTLAGRPGRRGG